METRPPPRAVTVGDFEIVSLPDARGSFGTYGQLFTEAPPEGWEPWQRKFPELFDGQRWVLDFGAFLVRTRDANVLVDTALGPPPGEHDFMPGRQGWLPESMQVAGIARDEIDIVFLTHHHTDHIGWNVVDGAPFFPRARYVTGAASWRWTLEHAGERHLSRYLLPLAEAIDLVEPDHELAPGVNAIPTPGHYPGHMSVTITSNDNQAVILGDVAVHPAQLSHPVIAYSFDVEQEAATRTRRELRNRLRSQRCVVLCSHYPRGGMGHLVGGSSSVEWEPRPSR